MDYRAIATQIAQQEGVPVDLFLRMIGQESAWQPGAVSPKGASGLAQLMPGTARELGVDPSDPVQNMTGGARYLRQQLDAFGRPDLALAAYNAGPGAVRKHGGIPPFKETQNYVRKILGSNDGQAIADAAMAAIGKQPQGQASTQGAAPMMQEEKPRGLLGSLGIQKMEKGAEGETGQRFYNRDSFKDTAAILAQGFGRMGIMGMEDIADSVANQRTEVKARNKTMEALSKMNTPQAQAAVEYINAGGDAVSALKMAFEKPKAPEDDRTAMMKNYEFYISKGMSPEQAMAALKSGTTIQMPGAPTIGTIPQGYQAIQDPQTGAYRLEVLEGGPAEAEARDAEARRAALETQTGQKETVVASAIDRLVGQIDKGGFFNLPEAGIAGNALGRMGVNQEAVDFRNELSSIEGNIAFDRLQQMREASKTGGALGAVSERELTLLMNAYGNVNQSTSPARLRENLLTIRRIMTEIENDPVASQFYYGQGRPSPAQTQSNGVSVGEPY